MQQYFINNNSFNKQDLHHIINVMRFKTGDKVITVENEKKSITTLKIENKDVFITKLEPINENNENELELTLCVGLLKSDKFDWVIKKTSELGVAKIIPTIFKRNIVKINNQDTKKIDRWKKIAKSACEQSKRNKITIIEKAMNLSEIVKLKADTKIVCYESREGKSVINQLKGSGLILIGPEGGIEDTEINLLVKNNFKIATISKQILRSETAAIAVATIFSQKEYENEE